MSSVDSKKTKRRKNKKNSVAKSVANSNHARSVSLVQQTAVSDLEDFKKLECVEGKDVNLAQMISLPRGPNPYIDREKCFLCGCERHQDSNQIVKIKSEAEKSMRHTEEAASFSQLSWVCPSCKSADSGNEKKMGIDGTFLDASFLSEISSGKNTEQNTNGNGCSCESCLERRQIEEDHEQETQELQRCWAEVRKAVRTYYRDEQDVQEVEISSLPDENQIKEYVHRLCSRDPHQLFMRLESQAKEFVIEKKVKLLKQLNIGYKSPTEAKDFVYLLLEEYGQLCRAALRVSNILKELENDHLKKFKVTWDFHNKHLFHSIAYTDPSIQNSWPVIVKQLRSGATSSVEAFCEDAYSSYLDRCHKFGDEMSLVSVIWKDCQQLIAAYNEEQAALKVKQKMLKEDWEFFKAQRKLLEQQVLKNPKASLSHSFEAEFTETMRHVLQGTKPSAEEYHCRNCNRKRCPCHECTITHMITCGIISPDKNETSMTTHHSLSFLHDTNHCMLDVNAPSVSSTTSSSGSSSPIMDALPLPFYEYPEGFENGEENQEEIEYSQSEEDEDDEEDEEDDEGEEDEDGSEGIAGDITEETNRILDSSPIWVDEVQINGTGKTDNCDCHHFKAEQMITSEDNQCQCHFCLQQRGKTVSTSLPQHVPVAPRPAELHLYPHIHGPSGLHGRGTHVRPILQPQLYNLHMPMRQQPKSTLSAQSKLPVRLDFDTPIHEHNYHAYSDWDNTTFDPRVLLSPPKYGGNLGNELLSPTPLSSNSALLSEHGPLSPQGTVKNTLSNHVSGMSLESDNLSVMVSHGEGAVEPCSKVHKCNNQSSAMKIHSCSRPVTLGGNSSPRSDKVHSQHCKKHGASVTGKVGQPQTSCHNYCNNTAATHSQPGKLAAEFPATLRNNNTFKEESPRTARNFNTVNTVLGQHPCMHANNIRNNSNHIYPASGSGDSGTGVCPNSVSMPTTINNVSVGTSTVCTDQECGVPHEDNEDSVDDSCSEQSSSTSTSNQKEGKYCDCCYCEFFGHGTPPKAPTSRNFYEMRERLQQKLKRKNEAKAEEKQLDDNHKVREMLDQRGLDELVRYINGYEDSNRALNENKPLNTKAAKRARQKQRKAEEKIKLSEEQRQLQADHCAEKLRANIENCLSSNDSTGLRHFQHLEKEKYPKDQQQEQILPPQKKKKGKHKVPELKEQVKQPLETKRSDIHCSSVKSLQRVEVQNVMVEGREDSSRLQKDQSQEKSNTQNKQLPATTSKQAPSSTKTALSSDSKTWDETSSTESPKIPEKNRRTRAAERAASLNMHLIFKQQESLLNSKSVNGYDKVPSQESLPPELQGLKKGKKVGEKQASHVKSADTNSSKQLQRRDNQTSISVNHHNEPKDQVAFKDSIDGRVNENKRLTKNKEALTSSKPENKTTGGKSKKNRKKNRNNEDINYVDEIFMPKSESDLENGEMDEVERELEEFKRFCLVSTPVKKGKLQVNVNLKDIFAKKKAGLSCS